MTPTRRSLLRTGGAALGTGTAAALAGCLGGSSDGGSGGGDGNSDGDGEGGSATDAWYATRLPAPAEMGHENYGFQYLAFADFLAKVEATGIPKPELSLPGIEASSIEHALVVAGEAVGGPGIFVYEGDFDPSEFASRGAAARDLSEQGTVDGYTLWGAGSEARRAIGVKQGSIVQGFHTEGNPTDVVRTEIATANGSTQRYVGADDAMAGLVGALGSATSVSAQRHAPSKERSGAVGEGVALTLADAESTVRAAMAFETAAAASPGALEDWASSTWAFDEAPATDAVGGGAVVTAEVTLETSAVEEASIPMPGETPSGEQPPAVAFEWEYESASGDRGTLTITHTSGETVRADRLFVRGSSFADVAGADMTAAGPWRGSTASEQDGEPAVAAGDRVTVGVTSDYDVRLVWEGDSASETLDRNRGPDA